MSATRICVFAPVKTLAIASATAFSLCSVKQITVAPLPLITGDGIALASQAGGAYPWALAGDPLVADPAPLLEALLRAELRQGRDRAAGRNAPRTLDLDLIQAEGAQGRWAWPTPADLAALGPELVLELPHPRARTRPFVVEPARALGVEV